MNRIGAIDANAALFLLGVLVLFIAMMLGSMLWIVGVGMILAAIGNTSDIKVLAWIGGFMVLVGAIVWLATIA